MHGEVLRRCQRLKIFLIVALQAGYKCDAHLGGEERVFTVGFLTASPARIAKNIDVRRPYRQTVVPVAVAQLLHALRIFGAKFSGDHIRVFVKQVGIERRRQPNRLREHSRVAFARHPVKAFAPPVVARDSQPGNCRSGVHHLTNFFFQLQAGHKILHPLLKRQAGITKRSAREISCRLWACGGRPTGLLSKAQH